MRTDRSDVPEKKPTFVDDVNETADSLQKVVYDLMRAVPPKSHQQNGFYHELPQGDIPGYRVGFKTSQDTVGTYIVVLIEKDGARDKLQMSLILPPKGKKSDATTTPFRDNAKMQVQFNDLIVSNNEDDWSQAAPKVREWIIRLSENAAKLDSAQKVIAVDRETMRKLMKF